MPQLTWFSVSTVNTQVLKRRCQTLSMCDCNVATGGAAMVKSVYSVGKPAFGVGQGNCQEIIDRGMTDEEYERLVKLAIMNRTVDNGVPCGGEQTAHVPEELLDKYLGFMQKNGLLPGRQ